MKKIYFFFICYMLLGMGSGCDDSNEKMFSGETSLHFSLSKTDLDSMVYSFLNISDNFVTVDLPVELAGYANNDVVFRLKVDTEQSTAIAGMHYEPLADRYTVLAGSYSTKVPVTMLYSPDLDSVAAKLVLKLEPLDGVVSGIPYRQQATIIVSNDLKPISKTYWNYAYVFYFGEYSKVKHRYILSELNMHEICDFEDYKDWWDKVSEYDAYAYGQYMSNFFAEHEIYDENGKLITSWELY